MSRCTRSTSCIIYITCTYRYHVLYSESMATLRTFSPSPPGPCRSITSNTLPGPQLRVDSCTPTSRDSGLEAFPDFDADFDYFSGPRAFRMHTEAFYFSLQPSEESLAYDPDRSPVGRKPSVLLPECNLVKSYCHRARLSADKPLPPTPLQPQLTRRKRSNRSVTPGQLQMLQQAVGPDLTPQFEWTFPSDLQGSFSSTDSAVPPSLTSSTTATSPRSTMSTISPISRSNRRTRQNRRGPLNGSERQRKAAPLPLAFTGLSMEDNPAYLSMNSPTFSDYNFLPSPDLTSSFQSSEPLPSLDCNETSGWEPDSDDENTTRTLRKKISRKFNNDRTSRPRTVSSATSASEVPTRKHVPKLSNSSTSSYRSTPLVHSFQADRHQTPPPSSVDDSQVTPRLQRPCVHRVHTSPSIVAHAGKKKVQFGTKFKGWFGKPSS